MTNEELKEYLTGQFPEANVVQGPQFVEMTVSAETLLATAGKLKNAKETSFDYLMNLTGIDYPDCISVVYHLESTRLHQVMVLKVKTANREEPVLDTVTPVWRTAKYHEREVFDLLGVKFNNHTDLRRLLLEDDWGYPLRKDYEDEVRIISR